jgi:hypothetical protein
VVNIAQVIVDLSMHNMHLSEARSLNMRFIQEMQDLEHDIIKTHETGNWTRCEPGQQSRKKATYSTCLIPGSGPGLTLRGVPYSVSI